MNKRFPEGLQAVTDGIDRLVQWAGGAFVCVMLFAIALQVVARYLLNTPPAWTEELARMSMVWVGLLGATCSFKKHFDPAIINLPETTPRWLQKLAAIVRALAVLIFVAPVIWYSFFGPNINPARSFLSRHLYMEAESLDISTIFLAVGVPICMILIVIYLLTQSIMGLTGSRPQGAPPKHPEETASRQ